MSLYSTDPEWKRIYASLDRKADDDITLGFDNPGARMERWLKEKEELSKVEFDPSQSLSDFHNSGQRKIRDKWLHRVDPPGGGFVEWAEGQIIRRRVLNYVRKALTAAGNPNSRHQEEEHRAVMDDAAEFARSIGAPQDFNAYQAWMIHIEYRNPNDPVMFSYSGEPDRSKTIDQWREWLVNEMENAGTPEEKRQDILGQLSMLESEAAG